MKTSPQLRTPFHQRRHAPDVHAETPHEPRGLRVIVRNLLHLRSTPVFSTLARTLISPRLLLARPAAASVPRALPIEPLGFPAAPAPAPWRLLDRESRGTAPLLFPPALWRGEVLTCAARHASGKTLSAKRPLQVRERVRARGWSRSRRSKRP